MTVSEITSLEAIYLTHGGTQLAKKQVTPGDIYELSWIEDPRLSPDGKIVAFVRAEIDREENKYRRSIWLGAADSSSPVRRFTTGKSDLSPRWRPDGTQIAFVSTRDGRPQIFIIASSGGEAIRLTDLPHGATNPTWSPDGNWIAFTSRLNADERRREAKGEFPPRDPTKRKTFFEGLEKEDKRKADPRVISRLPYRTGTDFLDDRRSHLFVIEAKEGAKPRRVTDGEWTFDPPTWSADGDFLYSGSTRNPKRDDDSEIDHDILRVRVRDGRMEWIGEKDYSTSEAEESPDGKWVAYVRIHHKLPAAEPAELVVRSSHGRETARSISRTLDRSIGGFHWSSDGRALYFSLLDRGRVEIYRANPATTTATRVISGSRVIESFDVQATTVVFNVSTDTKSSDLFSANTQGRYERRLTKFNEEYESTHQIQRHEEFWYDAPDGRKIQGWLIYPKNFNPRHKYPLLVEIHGGPHVMWAPGARTMWHEWQVFANRGYVVFYCNPRGSDGYGREHFGVIKENWGDADAPDILAGVDNVTRRGFIDTSRMAITGGSYGGFMTVWILGHDRRFAAAFSARGVYNLISFHGTTDFNYYWDHEFGGTPWESFEAHWNHSPLAYVKNIHTPLVIKHSDLDYRVPINDAEQLFVALRKLKRTVQFVRYPREGHELSRSGEPQHRVDRLERMLAWFDKYCMKGKKRK